VTIAIPKSPQTKMAIERQSPTRVSFCRCWTAASLVGPRPKALKTLADCRFRPQQPIVGRRFDGQGRFIWRSSRQGTLAQGQGHFRRRGAEHDFPPVIGIEFAITQPLPLLRRWLAGLVGDSLSDRGGIGREVLRFNATAAQLASTISWQSSAELIVGF